MLEKRKDAMRIITRNIATRQCTEDVTYPLCLQCFPFVDTVMELMLGDRFPTLTKVNWTIEKMYTVGI